MKQGLKVLGFIAFGIEILVAGIYGLTFIPWANIAAIFTGKVLTVIAIVLYNALAGLWLYLGYRKD